MIAVVENRIALAACTIATVASRMVPLHSVAVVVTSMKLGMSSAQKELPSRTGMKTVAVHDGWTGSSTSLSRIG